MKIGIIGAKEVGKTTLANLLTGKLKSQGLSCDLVPDVARQCPFPLNRNSTMGTAIWLFGAQIAAEALVEFTRDIAICDRTILDPLAFLVMTTGTGELPRDWHSYHSETVPHIKVIQDYLRVRPYDFLFYLPISRVRTPTIETEESFQNLYDSLFRKILADLAIDFMEIAEVQDDARVHEILTIIRQ